MRILKGLSKLMEQFFSKQFNNDELKALLRSITAHPDLAIILTNVPDMGDEMLNALMNSRFGQQSNVRLKICHRLPHTKH